MFDVHSVITVQQTFKQPSRISLEKNVIFFYVYKKGEEIVGADVLKQFVEQFVLEVVAKKRVKEVEETRIARPPYEEKKQLPLPELKDIDLFLCEWSGKREPSGKDLAQKIIDTVNAKGGPDRFAVMTFAIGESANVVTSASRKLKDGHYLDTIIFFNPRVAEKAERFKPQKFNKLFNVYSKYAAPTKVWDLAGRFWKGEEIFERKYQQQKTFNLERYIKEDIGMPVKNIRVLQIEKIEGEKEGKLVDVSDEKMLRKKVLLQIPTLLKVIERDYKLNFDFISKLGKEKIEPLVAINRPVFLKRETICFPTGDKIQTCLSFLSSMKNKFKELFTKELNVSRRSYMNLLNLKIGKTWGEVATGFFGKGLTLDIDSIKERYKIARKSELYESRPKIIINEKKLKEYFTENYPDFDFEHIKSLINKGGKFAYFLTYSKPKDYQGFVQHCQRYNRPEYLNNIIALMWYFFAEAINKDQGFYEGTFIFRNKKFSRIFEFLHTYVKKFGTTAFEGTGILRGTISSNPFAYPRKSSHFEFEGKEKMQHFGIDIRFTQYSSALSLLPAKKRHILFGKIEKGESLFIKFEHNGIYKYEVPYHGLNLIKSQLKKKWAKYIDPTLDAPDDVPNFRKERVPKREQTYFRKVSKVDVIGKEKYNIKFMLGEIRKKFGEKGKGFRTFYEWLKFKYDYAENRYGREVILTDLEFISSLFYNKKNNKIKKLIEEAIDCMNVWQRLAEYDYKKFGKNKFSNEENYFKKMLRISIHRLKVLNILEKLLEILKKEDYKIDYSIMLFVMKSILQKFSAEIGILKNQQKDFWKKYKYTIDLVVLELKKRPNTLKELTKTYKKLSAKFHPDKYKEEYEKEYFTLKFGEINNAYKSLESLLSKK